jgi:O-antigen ligase
VGIGAMAVSLLFYFAVNSKRHLIIAVSTMIIAISAYAFICPIKATVNDSGRLAAWQAIAKDMIRPGTEVKYPITGIGTGSFGYTFHIKHSQHKTNKLFFQAHNDYLELFWNTGLAGLALFLCAMFYVWKQNFSIKAVLSSTANQYRMALLSSFLCISLCAGGTFVFQIGTTIFYTILIVGLLTNTSEHKEEV